MTRRKIEYRGIQLEEMDLDAVLARRPTIALVDEVAATQAAAGSRNSEAIPRRRRDPPRWNQCHYHLNIQHLESLHDIVKRATGV